MSPRRRRLGALALGLVAALLVAEGVARIDSLFPGTVYRSDSMRAFLEARVAAAAYGDLRHFAPNATLADPSQHRPVPDPWSGWTTPAILDRVAAGSTWFQGDESARTFDVVLLGGSFAAQFGNVFDLESLLAPAREARLLGDRPVRLWSLAVAAQKQPSHLHRLTSILAYGWEPDLVVCIDGFNEIALAAQNAAAGANPVYPAVDHWRAIARAGDTDVKALDALLDYRDAQRVVSDRARLGLDWGIWRSALLSRVWLAWLAPARARFQTARAAYANWVDSDGTQTVTRGPVASPIASAHSAGGASGVAEGVAAWTEAAAEMRWIADRHGIPLVHAVQPALADVGSKPLSERERLDDQIHELWSDSIRDGYPLLRAAIARLAETSVLVRDGTLVFQAHPETLFVDGCHLNDDGYRVFGREIAAWVREALAARR